MNYEIVNLTNLKLDPSNPRLPLRLQHSSNEDIVNWMLTDASLVELMLAIGSNGFFPGEPLLVVEEDGKLVVIEGNRRLASLMLLNDIIEPAIQIGSVKQVKALTTQRPTEIPVIKFDARNEIEKYLGFRHVTGVKEWSPLAKARYLKSMMTDVADGEVTQGQYRELAKQIGSRGPYVQRLIVSYDLYEMIERNDFYNILNLNEETFHFTYLMDSLNRPEIRSFVGIDFDQLDVLSGLKAENFQQLIEWFFQKDTNHRTAMNASSGQLAKFCNILSNQESYDYFVSSRDLDSAYELTIDKSVGYRESVFGAERKLKEALISIVDVDDFTESDSASLRKIIKYSEELLKRINHN
ncbi:ParB N-terminal domain-containing protein [Photobacterium piscicola]|uniref:ParB N-terminal domain-containing protein n=1 Tax=Photobacterium piscicola TaxID=1378299 RepID=UPI0038D099DF